jgi:hypothetical protein
MMLRQRLSGHILPGARDRHVVTLERVADIFFMVGLVLLTVVALLFAYEII